MGLVNATGGCGAASAVHGPDALQLLLRLIDKSLVVVERRGRVQRYDMLETVRQYAEEKLIDSGEAADVQARHRDYYVSVAENAVAGLRGPEQVEWVAHLEVEHDNLRAARAWCSRDGRPLARDRRSFVVVRCLAWSGRSHPGSRRLPRRR
jgi:predicted ATPase